MIETVLKYGRRARQLGLAGSMNRAIEKLTATRPVPPDIPPPPSDGPGVDDQAPLDADGFINVQDLLRTLTVEQLATEADVYYKKNVDNLDYYFAKPFTNVDETPDRLVCFAEMIGGLRPLPGMRVLDFGAGTGWSTRYLAQLGCEVIATDVSATALEVAKQLFERLPVAGPQPEPAFLVFDGRRIGLGDGSVDRVHCFDALHHVPNPQEVLRELSRVLKPGGIAAFCEPGPNHSKTAQSQFDMRNYTIIENDILMGDIWTWAEAAGFTSLEISVFNGRSFRLSLPDFGDFLRGGPVGQRYVDHVRGFVRDRRIFFLSKGEPPSADSRDRDGLAAELDVTLQRTEVAQGDLIRGRCLARNVGRNRWLPSNAPRGPVQVGVHLYDRGGRLIDRDYARIPIAGRDDVRPGEVVEIPLALAAPPPGRYRLEFDMVSEMVCWFEINGCRPASVDISVAG
jgi:2-polyprenyl-3-methyl-5-hydroxy-6-metoxy-1,4-benzoquinol methylase